MTIKKDESARGWVVVASCFWLGFLTDGTQFSFGLLFIEFLSEFGQSKATTAWIGSLFLGWIMLGPVVGKLTDKTGCRLVVLAGGSLTFIGLIASVFSTRLGFLLMSFPRKLMIISYFEQRRSLAISISTCGSGIGTIVFNPLTKWLFDVYGWRGTLLIEAGLALNCIACGLVLRPFVAHAEVSSNDGIYTPKVATMTPLVANSDQPTMEISTGIADTATYDDYSKAEFKETLFDKKQTDSHDKYKGGHKIRKDIAIFRLLKRPRMVVLLIYKFFEGLAFYIPFTFLPDMSIHKGWSRAQAAWLLALIGVVNTICRIPIGRIADLKCVNRMLALGAAFILMGIMSMIMPFTVNYKVMIAECVIFAVFIAAYVVLCSLATADLFDETELTDVFGVTCLVFGVGSLASGPISGALFDATGDYTITFVCAGATTIVAGIMCVGLFCTTRQNKQR